MADNLIFPIRFDLESGVQDAIKKGDAALRQIEAAMNRKPIVLRAEVDANKFQMFSRQFSNSIDGISAKLAQAQRIWNSMSFDVKFDSEGNLSRRAQIVFDAFQQLTQASATMGQRLGEVNRNLAKSEADTARAITAEYNKRQQLINEQIRLKERQAAAEERVRQSQLKGVNVGYVDTQKQVEAVRNLRLQYEAILPMLNAMAQRRYDIKVGIDKQFEADIQRINAEIARLRQSNLQLGAKGDTNAIQANLQAIRQLEAELQRISQQKIDLLNSNKINSDLARLRTEISSVFGELQNAERKLAADNSLNSALDTQSQKVLKLHADIQKLDQQIAQLNAQGKMYNADGSFSTQAISILQQRIALTKQLEQEAITGQQAQIRLEQQLREEKRKTEQEAKNAAKEAERQAKAEAAARKQAQDAANAENKARQEAYNARRRQGQETQRILNKEAKSIADITAKLQIQQQRLQSANIGSAKFNKIAEEVRRLTQELDKANKKMRDLTGQTQSSAATQSAAVRQVSQEFQVQDGYISRLIKRMAVYASFSYTSQFLTNVREVTAQFELQRVSLGAIIQDQSRANQLWSEIKTFALKSPVKILDLTKYTKQVAAYGIETDKLFDTTKRIMDISVGLGVDAGRLVLAYGQVKAASYLRAAEIRQFTEAGIPMLELLAEKFAELNGKAVTTEQVMDMVSKRMVGFDMVEQIFKDMTSAGGMFFDMQEKQGNTLYGLWAKLGDAAAMMYDEIGNTDSINSTMKDSIQFLTDLMKNWRLVGREIVVAAGTFLLLRANTVLSTQGTALATKATNDYAAATTRLNAAQKRGAQTAAYAASLSKKAAVLNRAASISTNAWTAATLRLQAAMYSLKAAFIGNWVTLAIAAVAAIATALYSAYEKAHKLQNELKEISDAGQAESAKSVFNFERLANAALNAATGSREQKEALDELKRSYGDIIPAEQLSLENLQKLRAQGYEPLTAAIKEYIAQRTLQKEIDAITSHYTEDAIAKQRELRELFKRGSTYSFFKGVAWSPIEGLDNDQISQVFANVDKLAQDKSKSWEDVWVEAIKGVTDVSEDAEQKMRNLFVSKTQNAQQQSYNNKMRDIVEDTRNMADETDIATKKMETQTGSLGKYKQTLDETSKSLANLRLLYTNGKEVDASSFLGKQMVSNASIKAWKDDIVENLQDAGIAIKNEWFNIITNLNPRDPSKISSINFDPILDAVDAAKDRLGDGYVQLRDSIIKYQELYNGIVPSDRTVSAMRSRLMQIANNVDKTGNIMNDLQRHLMKTGDNWENYSKSVRDAVKDYEVQIDEMQKINASIKNGEKGVGPLDPSKYSDEEIKKVQLLVEALNQLFPFLAPEGSSNSGRQSNPRLQNLKEEISLVQKLYNEYKQLEKQEGASKAAADMRKMAGGTLDMFKERYNIDLPTDAKDLTAALEILYTKMAQLPKKVFPALDKDLKELRWTIEKVNIDESQKKIESELKRLADRISRTKTAKEFYEKILNMTGDIQLSANLAVSVYGQNGQDLQDAIREQIRTAFETDPEKNVTIDLSEAIDPDTGAINYNKLAELEEKYKDVLISGRADLRQKLIDEGRKTSAAQAQQWLKDIEKAKDFAQQRIDLATYTANQIAAINARTDLPQADKDKLTKGYQDREAKQLAKLQYDEFKDSAMYVHIFEDLDHASTTALKNMRDRLIALKGQWQHLDPTQVKELTKAIADLDEQIAGRSPFKSILDGFKGLASARPQKVIDAELLTATEELTRREEALTAATKKYTEAQTAQLNAQAEVAQARQDLEDALAVSGGEETAEVKAAREVLGIKIATFNAVKAASKDSISAAKTEVDKASEKYEEQKKVIDKLVEEGKIREANIKKIELANQKIDEYQQQINEALDGVRKMMEAFGASDEDMQFFDDVVGALNEIVDAGQQAAMSVASFMSGNILGGITSGVSAIGGLVSGFTNLFYAGRVKRANKEIKRQQELLDQLEYTYGRLEKAADKAFGADFVANQKQQRKILLAQAEAYQKQYQAELSKGKKADEEKLKEYQEKYRDTMDAIADMEGQVAERMLGTDLTSAARDFANAWLEAYKEFGNTADAMSEKFHEMIQNMIVESLLAKVMERALKPAFDMIDNMNEEDFYSESFWKKFMATAEQGAKDADHGAGVVMKWIEQMGYDMREMGSEYTGIAKEVSSASSEEINQLSAFVNTALYYVSPIPTISENVSLIRQLMERGTTSTLPDTTAAGWTDWQQQAMDNYIAIQRNTADTVVECRRAANACEASVEKLGRIITSKGSVSGVNVFMKG